jgi:hypothetical protein
MSCVHLPFTGRKLTIVGVKSTEEGAVARGEKERRREEERKVVRGTHTRTATRRCLQWTDEPWIIW